MQNLLQIQVLQIVNALKPLNSISGFFYLPFQPSPPADSGALKRNLGDRLKA